MPGIILEGGTFRPIFSAGVMDALLDEDIMFPYMIGVSAGICDGFSYISKQKERNLKILMNHRNDKRYMGARNLLKDRSLFGLDFVYDTIPNKLYPFDWKTFNEYKGTIKVGVTNAWTGKAEYKDGMKLDKKCTMLRATCAIPFVFPTIKVDGKPYYDGGIADPIPIRRSIEDGNEKNVVVLTRNRGYREKGKDIKIPKFIYKSYPRMRVALSKRLRAYNEQLELVERLEDEGKITVIRPFKPLEVDRIETDIKKLTDLYEEGYVCAKKVFEEGAVSKE